MAHPQQLQFVATVLRHFAKDLKFRVLEIGSYDVNGSVRNLFGGCNYVGVDLVGGPGVDLVGSGSEISLPEGAFEVCISCECFEHNPAWLKTLLNMYRMAKAGGIVLVTCAGKGRIEHGTSRSTPNASPGTQALGIDYYRNLTQADFEQNLGGRKGLDNLFSRYYFFTISTCKDLYFIGWKHGHTNFTGDLSAFEQQVWKIENMKRERSLKNILLSVYEAPLNVARCVLTERKFQDFAVFYTKLLQPISCKIKEWVERYQNRMSCV